MLVYKTLGTNIPTLDTSGEVKSHYNLHMNSYHYLDRRSRTYILRDSAATLQ